jgi:hypothetical protein
MRLPTMLTESRVGTDDQNLFRPPSGRAVD